MWKAVETKTGEAGMAEAEGRRDQEENRKKARKARKKEAEEEEGGRSKKDSGGVEDLGRRRESSKIRDKSKKDGAQKVSPIDKGIWEKIIREDANEKGVGPHNRSKREICTEEEMEKRGWYRTISTLMNG